MAKKKQNAAAKGKKKAATAPKSAAPKKSAAPRPARARGGGRGARAKPRGAAAGVRVRMYRQGLGDCFLLRFPKPKPDEGDFTILIDCGVILGTPGADALMKAVVADIAETTGKHLDVLVATHEHWDHISGFEPAKELFKDFQIDKVWMAWTEDPADATAQSLRRERAQRLAALWLGFGPLKAHIESRLEIDDSGREHLEAAQATVERAAQVLSFFGIDPETDQPPPEGGLGAAAAAVSRTGAAMTWARTAGRETKFWRPGDLIPLPEAGDVRVYVLGPPTNLTQLHKDMPTKAGRETYEALRGLAIAEEAFFAGALNEGEDLQPDIDTTLPFDRKYRIKTEAARGIDFFRDRYFGTEPGDNDAWRRIEGDWTGGAARFALQLDSDTNNTSLALAFELPDGRVLLFPGDAQVGNWESWHADPEGKTRVWPVAGREVTAELLLNRTVLYKVGHHGSHNATLRDKGLEMMTDKSLVAMVPVDIFVAHEKKHWTKMPFDPLMSRLAGLTGGRVLQADQTVPAAAAPKARDADRKKTIRVVIDGDGNTDDRPLYVEYSL